VASRLGASKNAHGLVVEDVDPNGRAADAGLQPGDVIEQVNRQPVENADQLKAALHRSPDKPVLLLINRQGNSYVVTVHPAKGYSLRAPGRFDDAARAGRSRRLLKGRGSGCDVGRTRNPTQHSEPDPALSTAPGTRHLARHPAPGTAPST